MKKLFTIFLVFIISVRLYSQNPCTNCPSNNGDTTLYDVITLDSRASQFEYVPGQILVKFKDEVSLVLGKTNGYVTVGVPSIDEIMQKYKVTAIEKVFPQEKKKIEKKFLKSFNGYEFEVPSLHNIYKLQCDSLTFIFDAIRELNENENVVYAEPNYIYSIIESEPLSPPLNEAEMKEWLKENPLKVYSPKELFPQSTTLPLSTDVVTPNDPLYNEQWGIPATQINQVWSTVTGDTTQLIAILDTGVDWLHPDLQNKIWINSLEIPDNGIDDDGNGFIDDIRGWDFINNDNNPMDDNTHGTHVAGIAAAEANNGIGIAGVNWGAKIMAIKVFQSSGRGDAAKITQGIIYAMNKGANVINMSFGSYARSLTMENALANAYGTATLVAAAGNDTKCIGPGMFCARFYPAAISYVLGIEATTQSGLAGFSNYDQDGPVFSQYEELNNYELRAPGVSILSLIPNGGYRVYNGTSMAAPLVSGAVSLYQKQFTGQSQELMWGNLINTINLHLQLANAMTVQAKPVLWFVSHKIVDTLDGDGDGRTDAGETIELWFEVRNTWGQADSVWVGIEFSEFEDTTTASIIKDKAFIGSISPYARRTNEFNTLRIHINPNVVHDRDIAFSSKLWYMGSIDTIKQQIILNIENGEELSGVMDSIMVLTPDKLWLVNKPFRVGANGKLYISPGTKVYIRGGNYIYVNGKIIAKGSKDSLIEFTSYNGIGSGIKRDTRPLTPDSLIYCYFYNIGTPYWNDYWGYGSCLIENCTFENILQSLNFLHDFIKGVNIIKNSIFRYINNIKPFSTYSLTIMENNNIYNVKLIDYPSGLLDNKRIRYNNFVNASVNFHLETSNKDIRKNNLIKSHFISFGGNMDLINIPYNYWGKSNGGYEEQIYDFWEDPSLPLANPFPLLSIPDDSAHGIVWKVLVNGKDAQEEFVEPLGVGTHRFDVYFNRPMDINYPPKLTFGVREPYTQHAVVDSASWSPDSTVWTAYYTVKLYTGDGINRIRVEGARDTEGFEIPIEDQRFEFLIDAAGSASEDFQATAGLGRVTLEWSNPDPAFIPDVLGYNMYRFEHINDSTLTEPILINSSLITDTIYTDFNVIPNKKYYYYYKIVRTNFDETDSSKIVSSIPFTASIGDANGDLSINILDITTIISFILSQNPQPFIFEAADVNQDGQVNILDVVGVVNIIMGNVPKFAAISNKPKISFDTKTAYIENGEGLAGLQFKLVGKNLGNSTVITGEAARGMELSYNTIGDTMYVVIYSFKNQTIKNSEKEILFKLSQGYFKELKEVMGSNLKGEKVEISLINDGEIIPKEYHLYQNYPNPFNSTTIIRYALPNPGDVELTIYNILGQKVWDYKTSHQQPGYYEITWNGHNNSGHLVSTGVYIYRIKADKYVSQKKMLLLK